MPAAHTQQNLTQVPPPPPGVKHTQEAALLHVFTELYDG